nr:hypothetical protein [Aeromicrobium sp.]
MSSLHVDGYESALDCIPGGDDDRSTSEDGNPMTDRAHRHHPGVPTDATEQCEA